MKKIKLILCVIIFITTSCSTFKYYQAVVLFQSHCYGMYGYNYLTLRMNSKIYEIYSPYSKGGTTGFFEIKKDTMFLYPKYEFNENLWYKTISDSVSVANTEKYLIQKDKLIEIPDSTYIELYFEITGQQPTKEYLPKPNVFTQIK